MQEFKVETSALPAQHGHHSSAAVNAVTKSGTNVMSGSAFEFMRDSSLNATNAFAAIGPDGKRRDDGLRRDQFGGTLGGPDPSGRLFYFGAYQGTRVNVTPTDFFQFVPTPAMMAGDFTAITSPACNAGRTIALRTPFVGTRVDTALFSPAARNLQARLPDADQRLRSGLLRSEDPEFRAPWGRSSRLPVEQQPLDLRPLPACAVPVRARQRSGQRAGLRERSDQRHDSLDRDRRHLAARIEYRQFVPRGLQQRRYS